MGSLLLKVSSIFLACLCAFFSILGILFTGFLIHEGVHVIHAKGEARAVCYAMGLTINDSIEKGYLGLYTDFSPEFKYKNVQSYKDWRRYSEKIAYEVQDVWEVLAGFIMGASVCSIYFTTRKRKTTS